MTSTEIFDFCMPEAQRVADLSGVIADLVMVRQIVNIYLGLPAGRQDLVLKDALCVSAVTTYARTCATGVRGRISSLVNELSAELRGTHEYFIDMRNKWAAHSVNEHESHYVGLEAEVDPMGRVVPKAIRSHSSVTVFLAPARMSALSELAESLQEVVMRELNSEKKQLLDYANSMDLSKLLSNRGMYSCNASSTPRASQTRARFK